MFSCLAHFNESSEPQFEVMLRTVCASGCDACTAAVGSQFRPLSPIHPPQSGQPHLSRVCAAASKSWFTFEQQGEAGVRHLLPVVAGGGGIRQAQKGRQQLVAMMLDARRCPAWIVQSVHSVALPRAAAAAAR